MRGLVQIGLAAIVAFAPAFCCCQGRLLLDRAKASVDPIRASANPQSHPADSCCHTLKIAKAPHKASCCLESQPFEGDSPAQPPAHSNVPTCCCLADRPDGTVSTNRLQLPPLEWTGQIISLGLPVLFDSSLAHFSTLGSLESAKRTGVDTRYAALFERHVMRC